MESDIAVKLSGVSKQFKLYQNPVTGPVKDLLFFWEKPHYYDVLNAVENVSMDIKKGEVVGIIGPNGAGKSTLLKMIAGLLSIDKGTIEVRGKVTALLALGTGVHPEFTGRENLLYNSMLLGMSKKEVEEKIPEMIKFSELEEFIDHPFRTYSSGMKARLLFASAMSVDPDILIIDEALATGDRYFIEKSRKRILDLCQSGATIIYVSHNLSQIEELCRRSFFMVDGKIHSSGRSEEVIADYYKWIFEKEKKIAGISHKNGFISINGIGGVEITRLSLKNSLGVPTTGYQTLEKMVLEIDYTNSGNLKGNLGFFIGISQASSGLFISEILVANAKSPNHCSIPLKSRGRIHIIVDPLMLLTGQYTLWIMGYINKSLIFEYKNVGSFFCSRDFNSELKDAIYLQPAKWSVMDV